MKLARIKFEEFRSLSRTSGWGLIGVLTLLCLAAGCGGGTAQPSAPLSVSVIVSPIAPTVDQGGTQNFTATVTGTANMVVTWSVQEGTAGGSITSAGAYTAPQAAGTYHVVATSQADNTKSATATVTVPPVAVTVSPTAATVFKGDMSSFTAMVSGTNNTAVTWSVQEGAAGGSITSAGVYTAPQTIGTFHVMATSQADNSKSASVTVTVPPVSLTISPASDTLGPKGLRSFVATVGGTNNNAVTWSVKEGPAGGTIGANGDYVAPTTQGTFHVVTVSVADPSMSAIAIVTAVRSGFLPTGAMTQTRQLHTATLLSDGKVLIAGGTDTNLNSSNTAEVFDPAVGTFTSTGSMAAGRATFTATLLKGGKVLVAGGVDSFGNPLSSAELYDPVTGTFSPTGSMGAPRASHTATLLQDGRVLIAGSFDGFTSLKSAELYDPASGAFTTTGSMTNARGLHTATLLQDGKVLMAGGLSLPSPGTLFSAEIYDPATGSFSTTKDMGEQRESHTATLLTNGKVLITGGEAVFVGVSNSAELYDPSSGTFTSTGDMSLAREFHTATLLNDGTVLVAGGDDSNSETYDCGGLRSGVGDVCNHGQYERSTRHPHCDTAAERQGVGRRW